ncbi:type II toxin-antitoxin system VapC family toxin [Rhizobium terrae]|uniref:type II toxin-antitoxin system VapC family toxin n=1 Tax=Rhizobium terrae TaxID=2171756 RepID=UPI001D021A3F|nr:type II toxin-antitoxin system VapC family toxin [Rhizobium terrae]
MEADTSPVDADLVDLVTLAWLTYGKGRHPAALNFASRRSYALAERADEPLPFMGKGFAPTDIEAAQDG